MNVWSYAQSSGCMHICATFWARMPARINLDLCSGSAQANAVLRQGLWEALRWNGRYSLRSAPVVWEACCLAASALLFGMKMICKRSVSSSGDAGTITLNIEDFCKICACLMSCSVLGVTGTCYPCFNGMPYLASHCPILTKTEVEHLIQPVPGKHVHRVDYLNRSPHDCTNLGSYRRFLGLDVRTCPA